MAVARGEVAKFTFVGVFKVFNQANPHWDDIKDQAVSELFGKVKNPTSWPSFFAEAVGTSIQQEFILHGSYCPGLEKMLVAAAKATDTWNEFVSWIQAEIVPTSVQF